MKKTTLHVPLTTSALYKKFFIQVTGPLLISGFLSLIPGLFLTHFTDTFISVPGLLMLVPALIGMRGNIFGSLSSRLSTELQIRKTTIARFHKKVRFLDNIVLSETLLLSFCLPALCKLSSPLLPHELSDFEMITYICMLSGLFSGSIMLYFTKLVIRKSMALGINPDNVSSPAVTTLGDLITLPIVLAITTTALALPLVLRIAAIAAMFLYSFYTTKKAYSYSVGTEFMDTIRQRLPVMLSCMAISFVAGIALEHLLVFYVDPKIATYMALIPLINAQGGSSGSVIASRSTTRYFSVGARKKEHDLEDPDPYDHHEDEAATSASGEIGVITVSMLLVLNIIGTCLFIASEEITSYVEMCTVMIIMSFMLSVSAAGIAVITVRISTAYNWHPDNVAVPVVCACMDVVASWGFTLLIVMLVYVEGGRR